MIAKCLIKSFFNQECVRQASILYQEDKWEYDVGQGVFTHNELEIGCEIDEEKTSSWKHHSLKTSIVCFKIIVFFWFTVVFFYSFHY